MNFGNYFIMIITCVFITFYLLTIEIYLGFIMLGISILVNFIAILDSSKNKKKVAGK